MVSIGDVAPDFTLLNYNNSQIGLSDYRGRRVIIAFFPAAFTGVCTEEMCTFEKSSPAFEGSNATVLGVCSDSRFANAAFAEKNGISFPILSDYTRSTIKEYGVELNDFAGMVGYTASERAVFIVDENGVVMWKWVGENPGVEPNYDEVIAAAGS
ncbi:MAG: redoxin domain-containing protein [Candidatus Thalassarchaeaceae archaeon]|nr:redoxin domain-containing protein [Candidatus Thalassarchaeaceae archaeon]